MDIRSITEASVENKRVLVRVDFNTPLDAHGNVANDKRIRAALPTINYLTENKAKVVILTHVGRPKGERVEKLQTNAVARKLSELIEKKVVKADEVFGDDVEKKINEMNSGDVIMLENVRFYPEEKENDSEFSKKIANLADIFVNDGFGVSHRSHASITGIPKYLPAYAGFLLEKEIKTLSEVRDNPEKPLIVVMGGVKLETRIPMIEQFIEKADKILFGGAMIFTFYKAQGKNIGKSLLDEAHIETAKMLLEKYPEKLVLPIDIVAAKEFKENAEQKTVSVDEIQDDEIGLDVGEKTIKEFAQICSDAKTIVWNGPLGAFEIKPFNKGTFDFATEIAKTNARTIIGGGDTAAAVEEANLQDNMSFISTGGGASLMLLEGKKLPGVEALKK